jgi:SH3 domain-containing YSC84-like protein 1
MLLAAPALAQVKEARRLDACREVLEEILAIPEGIPRDLLRKAACVAVIPSTKKFAFGVGGRYGKGAVTCRTEGGYGPWSPPLMITVGGGSFGLQIGGQAADYVMLIMNEKGAEKLMKSKFTLGADATVAAGPKGRSAEAATDAFMHAEILTYSRTRGLFAGLSLEGTAVSQDEDGNWELYGKKVSPREVLLTSGQAIPEAAKAFVDTLRETGPRKSP